MRVEQKLTDLGLELGKPGTPVANYISAVKTGNLLFVAGHIPFLPDGSVLHTGKLGRDISDEQGYEAAKTAMVNCLVSIKDALGDVPLAGFFANGEICNNRLYGYTGVLTLFT